MVYRDDVEVDRYTRRQVERVVLLHRGSGDSPGDLVHAVVVLADDCLVLPAETGFAGRVHFERQPFWAERGCVHWARRARAAALRLRNGLGFLRRSPPHVRAHAAGRRGGRSREWPLQGAQTWEQRKRRQHRERAPVRRPERAWACATCSALDAGTDRNPAAAGFSFTTEPGLRRIWRVSRFPRERLQAAVV